MLITYMKKYKSIKRVYLLVFLMALFLLISEIGFTQTRISLYGDFPYQQSFHSTSQPDEISKPSTSGSTTNAARFTAEGLQLTPAVTGKFGAVFVNDRRFGSTNGIKIEFEYMVYGGSGADGFTVFFFDESEKNPQIGSYGAAIGYSYNRALLRHNPQDRMPGLTAAYLGIAFDSFGNFKKTRFQPEEIIAGLGRDIGTGSHVTLRGAKGVAYPLPGMENGYTGYPVLISQSTKLSTNNPYVILDKNGDYNFNATSPYEGDFYLRGAASFNDGDVSNPAYRKAFINIFPIDDNAGGMYITVKIQHGNTITTVIDDYPYRSVTKYRETAIVHATSGDNIYGQIGEDSKPVISSVLDLSSAIPNFIRIGFAAATGQGTDIHTIKNLKITLPGAAEAYDDFASGQVNVPVVLNPFENDIAYRGVISENMVGSSSYINPASFRFRLANGDEPDSDYIHQVPEGTWIFEKQTGLVTFIPVSGFEGEVNIQYSIKGGLPGNTDPFEDDAYESLPATITVKIDNIPCPEVLVWTGDVDSDWNKEYNWYPNDVPASCTDVYIPGNVAIFPTLTDFSVNECRNIYFMPGAQLGQPQLLAYEKAHVELDYGAGSLSSRVGITKEELVATGRDNITSEQRINLGVATSGVTLNRGRWNMLSAPLGNMVTGDFAFGGFPFSFIKKFDADGSASSYIMGKWADFSNETNWEFQPGQGFGHYYYPYITNTPYGMDNSAENIQWNAAKNYNSLIANAPTHIDGSSEFGLAQSNGILHFPYFSDEYLSATHRAHQYNKTEISETSSFNFFYQTPLNFSEFLQFTGDKENVLRTNVAYRFITENWNEEYNAGTFDENEIVLVGNPYMSALDFDEFYEENSSRIKKVFNIYQSPNTYITYIGDGSNERFIAPMQSFLVETAVAGNLDLSFNAVTMAQTNAAVGLKTSRMPVADYLTIRACNQYGETNTYICQLPDADNGFDCKDFSKIIDKPDKLPRVYTLVNMKDGRQRALSMNSIQKGSSIIVPIGLTSTNNDNITLNINGMDNFDADIFFIDRVENTKTEITGKPTFKYTFNYHPEGSSEIDERFELHFSPNTLTGLENENPNGEIIAYVSGNDLIITTSGMSPIRSIVLYDLQGRCLLQRETGGFSSRIENVFQNRGMYIVKIHTEQDVKEIKIIK